MKEAQTHGPHPANPFVESDSQEVESWMQDMQAPEGQGMGNGDVENPVCRCKFKCDEIKPTCIHCTRYYLDITPQSGCGSEIPKINRSHSGYSSSNDSPLVSLSHAKPLKYFVSPSRAEMSMKLFPS